MYKRENCSGNNGYIRTSDDLEQAKRMRDFFIAPRVPTHHCDPQYFDLRRLDHHEKRLQIAAAGSGAVLVDNHFASWLRPGERTHKEQHECEKKSTLAHGRGGRVIRS